MADKNSTIPKGWRMTTLGEIPESWQITTAEKFCLKVADGTHATPKPVLNGKYLVTSKHIKSGKVDLTSAYLISQDDFNEVNKRSKVDQWDILFSMIGTVGEIAIIDKNPDFAIKNVGLFKCGNEFKAKWLFYFLRGRIGQGEIQQRMNGTTQSYVTLSDLKSFPIIVPSSSDELKAIAAVLSSLDDKIELLREQNKTLEAIAQTIFKEWFVNFNFPGATGKMIDSELGKIPEGWEVEKITDIFEFIKGSEPGAANYSNEKPNSSFVPFYRVQDISQYGDVPSIYVEEKLLKGKIFGQDDILISLDGTIGRVFIGGSGGHSGGIRRVIEKQDYIKKSLIFCFLKSAKFQNDLKSFSEAETTIKHAGGAVEYMKFVLNEKICERFGETIDPLFQKIISNISQIQTLSALRDTLLPKLMKGEIRVAEFNN